ncbi:unnamed protein product [Litomosoides sigmodontis]|uniref:Cadherin domain-containing protein n=1 Tax=Litomosoides sigmodontis TaxID=42156 RepID=A0A3P6T9W5_LITSI|nr:unnamed protein product [Litomosoides sigmodontis]
MNLSSTNAAAKGPFRINTRSGRLCLNSPLDYEQCTTYQLHVYAHHINGQSSRAVVNVHVEDVNDNAPVFHPQQYNVSVREDVEIGSLLTLLSADDADSGPYGEAAVYITAISNSTSTPQFTSKFYQVSVLERTLPGVVIGEVKAEGPSSVNYSIYSGDSDHFFAINDKNGQISVAQYLDADKWEHLLLNVEARVDGGGWNYTQVLVKLTDANDNAPTFEVDKVESYIYENHPTRQPFFAVQAFDKDRGKNGEVIYAVLQSEPPSPVTVSPLSGELTLTAKLDFEAISKYYLVIQAQDQGIPPLSSNISVVLNVLDVNDNRPEFEEEMYSVEVPEDAQLMTDILTVQAKDLDREENGRISYRLNEENSDFGIHPVVGNIFVNRTLDREAIAEYRLLVIATDHGKPELSSQATVHIKILDINDNSPSCPTANSFTLTDDVGAGGVFEKVIATDPDEGLNGSLLYRLHVEDVNFAIEKSGELFLKRKLLEKDYRKEVRLSVVVLDRNGDVQARSTICPIRITVGKVHSKVKFLEPVDRIINIGEKCTSGCLLKILNATDVARWEIEMSDISSNFEIFNNTLRTSAYFDAATMRDRRTLSVIAFDNDGRQKQITFTICTSTLLPSHLDDKANVIRIPKTAPVGSKLATLSNEQNSGMFWYLKNETDAFYLDSVTSALFLTTNIRWVRDKSYLLSVQKWNSQDNYEVEQRNVYIEVEPANIHWPQFSDCPRFFTVKENVPTGSIIGKVSAEDDEEDPEGQLSYSIVEGSVGLFSIDPDTAEILLIRPLRWEQDLSLFLVVEVEDNYLDVIKRSRCVVFIDVEDTNDNEPQFLSSQKVTIDDDFVDGDVIHHAVAVDGDAGANAKITYGLIEGNEDNAFIMDPNTGALALRYRFSGERSIRIRASDSGLPPKYVEKNVTVKFHSGHHRLWRFFPQRQYFIRMNSSAAPGTVVFDFLARGGEWPQMKLFPYFTSENDVLKLSDDKKLMLLKEITPGKYDWLGKGWNIQLQNSSLLWSQMLEKSKYLSTGQGDFFRMLTASGARRLLDWVSVHLSVIGANQYPPRISSSSCGHLTIRENVAAKHLTRIYAWDKDDGSDGEIFYKIVAGNENSAFFLNSSTGLLSCRELDREQQSQYFLVITAEDQGTPKRADTCTLRITVIDENDNVPVFDDTVPTLIEIGNSRRVGEIIGRLSATDLDEGPNGKITYNIVEDSSGLLDVRAYTGEIVFARDYPISQGEYRIKVKVEDQGASRVLSSELDIQLHLTRSKSELTLEEPQFLSEHYIGFINEGEQHGQFVLQIHSSDRLTEDAPLAYSIVSGNMDAAFDIDDAGRITSARELDYEIKNAYTLKVIGTGSTKNTPETNVHIRVINTNDNVPSFPTVKTWKAFESATYGTLVGRAVATDVDTDTQLEYSLLSSDGLFEIDPFTGKIFLIQNLDYETSKEHTIHVQVTDGENTSRTALRIVVEDVNDNAPQFEEQFYLINIAKDVELGSSIAKIRANDPDTGLAGTIRYELAANSVKDFRIDSESGDLLVAGSLKEGSTYYLEVHAFDWGKPVQSSAVAVQINVGIEDYDQKPIQFTETSFNFTVPEDIQPYTELGKVTLIDDLPRNTLLRIQNFEYSDVFDISSDGSIYLKHSIDAELKSEFEFLVEASSPHATYNSSTKVYVKVVDLNDNVPYFAEKINEIMINEGMIINAVLARFVATDDDSGDNGRVSYLILSGNDYGLFNLNSSSGILYLNRSVDIEEMHLNDTKNDLLIAAIDNGAPPRLNYTSVRIRLNSDFSSATAPFFVVPQYQANVFEDLPKGSIVLRSKAVNKLGLPGDDWTYTVTDISESFACDGSTGHLVLIKNLDFETQTKYEFILKVQDSRNRSAAVPVLIQVFGIDEYPPVFTAASYVFQIPENAKIGQRIGVVSAVDQDSGMDGVVRYEIQGSAARYLSVDPSSGQIVLSHKLHYRSATNITSDEFTVTASSSAKQTSRVKVTIQIGDFWPQDSFLATKSLTTLAFGSLLLLFFLLVTLITLIVSMRTRSRAKPMKQVYSINENKFAVVRDLNRQLPPCLEQEAQPAPFPSSPSPHAKFKNSSSLSTHINNSSTKFIFKSLIGTQLGNHSTTYSMPDSGIEPDDMSVTSSVTDYLNQVGVTPNKYFESSQCSPTEPLAVCKDEVHSDPEINDLIYAKVDEILSPASRMNVCFTSSTSSINISSFSANALNCDPVPAFQPLSELLLDMKKLRN